MWPKAGREALAGPSMDTQNKTPTSFTSTRKFPKTDVKAPRRRKVPCTRHHSNRDDTIWASRNRI